MDRETYKITKGTTVRKWCEKNSNFNLIENWDYEKNGNITPDKVARYSKLKLHFVCHICGNKFQSRLIDVKAKYGCSHCRGNKYVDLGKKSDYTVYCHTTPDGKRYIGYTGQSLKCRFVRGKGYNTPRFRDAIEKYGWDNIEHSVLESGLTKEEASQKEIYYINLYNTMNEEYGYNISTGGIHGYHPISHSKEVIEKIAKSNIGKKRSAESRHSMSVSHIGLDNHKEKEIYKLDLRGNIICLYKSAKEAAEKNGCKLNDISRCARGKRKTCMGYIWKYKCEMEV